MQKQQYLPDIGSLKEDKELIWTLSMCWLWSCAIKICPSFLLQRKLLEQRLSSEMRAFRIQQFNQLTENINLKTKVVEIGCGKGEYLSSFSR